MTGGRTQGETMGPEQEPTEAGDQDPAKRAPEPDGPMTQRKDPAETGQGARTARIVEEDVTSKRG
jgi:hypothetical protein